MMSPGPAKLRILTTSRNRTKPNQTKLHPKAPVHRDTDRLNIVPGLVQPNPSAANLKPVYALVGDAQIQLRFGIAEQENVSAFDAATQSLKRAEDRLDELPAARNATETADAKQSAG